MGKTAELRKLVTSQLNKVQGNTHHKTAPDNEKYPYKTYTLKSVAFTDARDDYDLCVDIWDRSKSSKVVEGIADQIEALFNGTNLPQTTILPTFFRENRYVLEDSDKELQHIQLRFLVQLYEMEG